MRRMLAALALLAVAGCGGTTLRSAVQDGLGDPIDVTQVKHVCDLPPGTPITESYVLLGCTSAKAPIVLDLVCQEKAASSKSCAFQVDAFLFTPPPAANAMTMTP
jgi:hypothetical protein